MTVPSPRSDGRWGGALTGRALPEDGELGALPATTRTTLAKIWFTQAATELRVARSFAIVHESLAMLGADTGLVHTAERAIDDEHRHALLCLEVSRRYAGTSALPEVPELVHTHPRHPSARDEHERRMLYVIGQCAFNETFASAYLSLARESAKTALARAAISELLSDEIDHARVGWAYLATAPAPRRARLAAWAHALAVANLREWRTLQLNRDRDLGAHGIPEAEAIEEALLEALRGVIIPGLATHGVSSRALESWAKTGAPT